MKKVIAALAVSLAAFAFSQEQGVSVDVELLSGTKQHAQFLGITNDTVQLGGYIQNKFTVLRIPKEKFKSIKDSLGNDMLNAPANAPADSSAMAASATDSTGAATDSVASATDSTATDSNATVATEQPPALVAYDSGDSADSLAAQITALTARLLFEDNEPVTVFKRQEFAECTDDICIRNTLSFRGVKTMYLGKVSDGASADSITFELTRAVFEDSLPEMHKAQMSLSRKSAMSDALKEGKLQKLILTAKGIPPKEAKPLLSHIYVDSDPEGATVSRPEKNAICKTPCTFAINDTGKVEVNAYWNVESQLWGAQAIVRPIPGDTAKVSLRLKQVSPEVHIISNPADAEIFPGKEPINKKSESIGKTPTKFILNEPGMANITLRRIGYKDTVVSFYAAPVNDLFIKVDMEQLSDYNEIAKQEQWQSDRTKTKIGHAIMAGSIAPIIMSAIFLYLGNRDYDDARDIKDDLKMPGSVNGEKYQEKVKKNKDLVDSGDKKMIIGASLAGAGVLLFGFGFFLSF